MSRFTQDDEPLGRFLPHEKDAYQLHEDLVYSVGGEETGELIKVPAGTITDFASIPVFFQRILPKLDTHRRAAILHDYLYQLNGKVGLRAYTREQCDGIFLEAMEVLGVSWWKRHAMFRAVRMFGWSAWNEHAERLKRENLKT